MTIIAQISENEQREIAETLKKFITDYKVKGLLKACRAEKQKGYSAFEICHLFRNGQEYRREETCHPSGNGIHSQISFPCSSQRLYTGQIFRLPFQCSEN